MPLPVKEKKECYEEIRLYDFYEVMLYMNKKYDKDFHDIMFEMISHSDQEGKNDSVHKLYRHWLVSIYADHKAPPNAMQVLFDLICEEFGIEHDIDKKGEDSTKIYLWVSW